MSSCHRVGSVDNEMSKTMEATLRPNPSQPICSVQDIDLVASKHISPTCEVSVPVIHIKLVSDLEEWSRNSTTQSLTKMVRW